MENFVTIAKASNRQHVIDAFTLAFQQFTSIHNLLSMSIDSSTEVDKANTFASFSFEDAIKKLEALKSPQHNEDNPGLAEKEQKAAQKVIEGLKKLEQQVQSFGRTLQG